MPATTTASHPVVTPPATIGSVLRKPEVARTLGSSVLARIPFGAMELLTVLRINEAGFSWGQAGLAAAGYAIAVAICQPALSRLIDRDGQTRVLLITGLFGALATCTLALMPSASPLWLFFVVATITGAAQPPLGGTMRALWDVLLTSDDERHVGFAVEATAVEIVFTFAPLLLVGVIAAVFDAQTGLLACAVFTGLGTLAFATAGPSRRWQPNPHRSGDLFGALRSPGVWTLMACSAGAGAGFGSIEIAITAFGRDEDNTTLIGLLLAIWSIASLIGGLVMTRTRPAKRPGRRLVVFVAIVGLGNISLAFASSVATLALLLIFAGVCIAPMFATANALMGSVAPRGMMTEAFSWTLAAIMVGITIGTPVSGYLIDHVSINAAFAASGVPLLLAAVLIWFRQGTLLPSDDVDVEPPFAAKRPRVPLDA